MAYDESLAQRVRKLLAEQAGLSEQRMFGGLAFLLGGHMCVGIVKDRLMVRVGPAAYASLVAQPHARKMDFTGRPMKGLCTSSRAVSPLTATCGAGSSMAWPMCARFPASRPEERGAAPSQRMAPTRWFRHAGRTERLIRGHCWRRHEGSRLADSPKEVPTCKHGRRDELRRFNGP